MNISDKAYDIIKWIAQYLLPALATLYFGIASAWGLPYGEEIVGTISAIDTFLGIMLGVSAAKYKKLNVCNDTTVFNELNESELREVPNDI